MINQHIILRLSGCYTTGTNWDIEIKICMCSNKGWNISIQLYGFIISIMYFMWHRSRTIQKYNV